MLIEFIDGKVELTPEEPLKEGEGVTMQQLREFQRDEWDKDRKEHEETMRVLHIIFIGENDGK